MIINTLSFMINLINILIIQKKKNKINPKIYTTQF